MTTIHRINMTCERIQNVKDRAFVIANNYALTPDSIGPVSDCNDKVRTTMCTESLIKFYFVQFFTYLGTAVVFLTRFIEGT